MDATHKPKNRLCRSESPSERQTRGDHTERGGAGTQAASSVGLFTPVANDGEESQPASQWH